MTEILVAGALLRSTLALAVRRGSRRSPKHPGQEVVLVRWNKRQGPGLSVPLEAHLWASPFSLSILSYVGPNHRMPHLPMLTLEYIMGFNQLQLTLPTDIAMAHSD